MDYNCCLYSQHFKGEFNNVSDALSRKHELTDSALISFILTNFPSQVPYTFTIDPLPPSIVSWTTWLLLRNKEHMESKAPPKTKKRGFGIVGSPTSSELKMNTILTSNDSSHSCAPESSAPSEQPSDEGIFLEKIRKSWEEAQSRRPWQSWVRCSGQMWGSTPTMAQTVTHLTPSCPDN